jgi:hypothetical protein
MYKNTAQIEKMSAIENIADPKIIGDGLNHGGCEIKVHPKTPAAREKQADGKISAYKGPITELKICI